MYIMQNSSTPTLTKGAVNLAPSTPCWVVFFAPKAASAKKYYSVCFAWILLKPSALRLDTPFLWWSRTNPPHKNQNFLTKNEFNYYTFLKVMWNASSRIPLKNN